MLWDLMAVLGFVAGGVALRSFAWAALRKLGALFYLVATYWAGWRLTGHHAWGVVAVGAWFFLPWVEILGRVRYMRLPLDRPLKGGFAPSQDRFPELSEMTDAIEKEGFTEIEDARFETGSGSRQFIRLFYNVELRLQAVIHFLDQEELSVTWASLTTRTEDGRTFTTWTFPFSQTMKAPPDMLYCLITEVEDFPDLMALHDLFLEEHGAVGQVISPQDPEELAALIEKETRRQVDHNLDEGLIRLSGNGTFRYSWRGYLFLWKQFVIDMVRLS